MAGVRFGLAGLLMYGFARFRGAAKPTLKAWKNALLIGSLLMFGGNGLVTWAEQWVSSGVAALFVTTVPLWLVILDWLFYKGRKPSPWVWLGLTFGFLGVVILAAPSANEMSNIHPLGAGILLLASFFWANGSLKSRQLEVSPSAPLSVGMEMLAGGAVLFVAGLVTGEGAKVDLSQVTATSLWAVAYLIVFGSIIALSAYVWLLKVVSPAKVGTYAFVNPVIAVFLGWAFANEPVTPRTLLAGTMIVGAVVMIHWARGRVTKQVESPVQPETQPGLPLKLATSAKPLTTTSAGRPRR